MVISNIQISENFILLGCDAVLAGYPEIDNIQQHSKNLALLILSLSPIVWKLKSWSSTVRYSQGIVNVNYDRYKRLYACTTVQVRSWLAQCKIATEQRLKRRSKMRNFNFILVVYFMTLSIVKALCTLGWYDEGD